MVYSRWQYDMSCMDRTGTWHLVYDKWYMVCRKLNRMYVIDGIMCRELHSGTGENIKMQMQSQVFGRHIHRWVVGRETIRENVSSVCSNVYVTLTLARENVCWGKLYNMPASVKTMNRLAWEDSTLKIQLKWYQHVTSFRVSLAKTDICES